MPRTINKRPARPGKIKSPDRRKKDNSCEFTAPKVPNVRLLEAGKAVQKRAILALKKAEERSTINHSPKLSINAKHASDDETQRENDLQDSETINNLVKSGMSLESAIRKVRPKFSETIGDQPQQERSLIGELSHSQRLTNKINEEFKEYYGKEHDMSPSMTEVISATKIGTFAITIKKIGKAESNRAKILTWLADKNAASKPILYKNREADPITKKKLNPADFFADTYGEFVRTKSIYAHEFRKLDPALYMNISATVSGGISSLLPTKSEKITADIMDLVANNAIGAKAIAAAYGR